MWRVATVIVSILIFQAKAGDTKDNGYSNIEDLLQIGGDVKITQLITGRTAKNLDHTIEDGLENFFKVNDITMSVPFDSTVTFSGRGLDDGELDVKFKLNSGSAVEARKKSRIKKILAPILVVLLLKAITLIPLALGLLGLKTWNALQLSFVSFVTSIILAVWKLCSKFSDHHQAPHIIHEAIHDVHVPQVYHDSHHVHHGSYHDDPHEYHDPWSHQYHRSDQHAQHMAFNQYAPEAKI